jgi:hypothetical protein
VSAGRDLLAASWTDLTKYFFTEIAFPAMIAPFAHGRGESESRIQIGGSGRLAK